MKAITVLIVAALALASVYCNDEKTINPEGCGLRLSQIDPSVPDKIVGGVIAEVGDWGWQAQMFYLNSFSCGGTLINRRWILTAAHCIINNDPARYKLKFGLHDQQIPETWSVTRNVEKIIKHENYSSSNFKNDIALIKLSEPVEYSKYIVPVCIPKKEDNVDQPGRSSFATGWGTTRSGGYVSRFLQEVEMKVLSDAACKMKYPIADVECMICAGETGDNKDTCQGDSGGPLVVKHTDGRHYKVGVTSFGRGCGNGGVYAKTSTYVDWIRQHLANN